MHTYLSVDDMIKEFKKSPNYEDWSEGDILFMLMMDLRESGGKYLMQYFYPKPGGGISCFAVKAKDVILAFETYTTKLKWTTFLESIYDSVIYKNRIWTGGVK